MTLTWLQECNKLYHVPISWKYCYYTHSMQRLITISLKINLFSPWYGWNIAELALINNHAFIRN
jgi:hypothetical protein